MATGKGFDRGRILQMAGEFRSACVLGAAAELNLFTELADGPASAAELADRLAADRRGMTILLDALAALGLLRKQASRYEVPEEIRPLLTEESPQTALPMVLHQMTLVRTWSQLARVVKTGEPAVRQPSIRGPEGDRASFIGAMHAISGPMADGLAARLGPPEFRHVLDVGGASGTWTLALLRAMPGARATIFDLPDAIEQARARLAQTALADRVTLVAGDFYADDLPAGVDLVWLSAIVHQHSREHNRRLLAKIHAALVPGGRLMIRDVVMGPDRTQPVEGALFAVNMLVGTATGSTFTLDEFIEDLEATGFRDTRLLVKDEWMNSVVEARRP